MKLLRIAAWTVWFMFGFIAAAHALPVITAIGAFLTSGTLLAKLVVGLALQIGASLLQKALAKRQPEPGISGQLRVGGNNSFSFIVGNYATAGSLDYVGTWGRSGKTPNAYLTQVITLSDMVQGDLGSRFYINNELCEIDFEATPVDQGYPVLEYRRNGRDYMWVKLLDGTQTVADAFLVDKFGSDAERPWSSDMVGSGSTVVVLTALMNRELMTAMPVGRYEPTALPLYDPRKDDTVGGDGDHRWGQPATYESTANPIVIIYNILRGIYVDGEKVYGPGISASRLPLASWFAAMNECDVPTIVADAVGEVDPIYEPQFSCGYEIKVAEHEPADVIEELLKSCNGQYSDTGGICRVHVGAPGLPVMFMTDDDWVVTDPQEFEPFKGLEQTFNGATATYPDPAAAWEMKDAPQRLFPDYEEEDDGRILLADFQFNAVSSPTQVQRLMLSMVRDGRRVRSHRGTLPPVAFGLEPLDTVSWTSARNGYEDKLFTVSSKDEMTNVNQGVALQEVDPSDYSWTPGTDKLPWSVGPINPRWPAPIPVAGWSVVASSINDESGTPRRPAIDLYAPGDNDDVRAIQIEVRNGEDELVFSGESPYGDVLGDGQVKTFRLSGQWCLPDQPYTVRGRFLPHSGRELLWTGWMPVTTLDIRLGAGDIYPDGLIPDLQEFIDDAIDWIGPGVRELIDDARRLVASVLDQASTDYTDRQLIRQQVTSATEDAKAYADFQILAATGPGSALAQALLAVQAELDGKAEASALLALTSRVDDHDGDISALSQALIDVNAELGDKADASALLALTTRVDDHDDDLSALSQALIDVNAELDDKADASAVLLLSARVDDVEGDVTSLSNAVIALESGYNDATASANFRMTTSAGPAGYGARIGMEARATGSGINVYRAASLFIDVPTSGAQPTRVVITADQFAVTNGTAVENPLVFSGGVLRLGGGVRAAWAQIDNVNIGWADIENAVVNNFVATSANIGFAVINDGMIAAGAVTNSDDDQQSGTVGSGVGANVWVDVASITIASPSGNSVFLYTTASLTRTQPSGGVDLGFQIRVIRNSTVLRTAGGTIANNATITMDGELRMDPAGVGTHTYKIQMQKSTLTAEFNYNATIIGQCAKK